MPCRECRRERAHKMDCSHGRFVTADWQDDEPDLRDCE